jgi:hypothetical protein
MALIVMRLAHGEKHHAAVSMSDSDSSVGRFYEGWKIYNERIVEVVRDLSAEELQVRPAPDRWPIWATVGHAAGVRVYWLCGVFGEPGAETTPFPDPLSGIGWEDDLDTPRTAAELTGALESSWRIIAGCLQRWTPDLLFEQFEPRPAKGHRSTRASGSWCPSSATTPTTVASCRRRLASTA